MRHDHFSCQTDIRLFCSKLLIYTIVSRLTMFVHMDRKERNIKLSYICNMRTLVTEMLHNLLSICKPVKLHFFICILLSENLNSTFKGKIKNLQS